jgi:cytochrome c oxidase subunit 2
MGQCAEFCGASHANMRLRVIAHEPQDFERWVSEQRRPPVVPTDALAQRGKELFEGGACIGCHVIEGVSEIENTIGPNLTHVGSRETFAGAIFPLTEENLAEWLANPPAMKPGSLMPDLGLSDEDIEALVAYLMTLT